MEIETDKVSKTVPFEEMASVYFHDGILREAECIAQSLAEESEEKIAWSSTVNLCNLTLLFNSCSILKIAHRFNPSILEYSFI